MATLDFTPLFRSSVGFDRIPDLLTSAMARPEEGYPPYNVEKCGEDRYRIVMALAGFSRNDLEIIVEQNHLVVRGEKKDQNGTTVSASRHRHPRFHPALRAGRFYRGDRGDDGRWSLGHRTQAGSARGAQAALDSH